LSGSSNKPNYCLAIKVTGHGTNNQGRRIRRTLFNRITAAGWQTPNSTTSWLYYRLDTRSAQEFQPAASQAMDRILSDMKQVGHQNYIPGAWQVRWILLKPLKETETRADLGLEAFFAEPNEPEETELASKEILPQDAADVAQADH